MVNKQTWTNFRNYGLFLDIVQERGLDSAQHLSEMSVAMGNKHVGHFVVAGNTEKTGQVRTR